MNNQLPPDHREPGFWTQLLATFAGSFFGTLFGILAAGVVGCVIGALIGWFASGVIGAVIGALVGIVLFVGCFFAYKGFPEM